ncbi:terminal nucleotidyltransferase 5C-like [Neosynchiropus ocellatus]
MTEIQTEKRFHNLTLEQLHALHKVLTEVIPIHGRGNFPTLQVRAKDIIRLVKDRLMERDIHVKDIRLNGATASHVLVRDSGLSSGDLDIIFGVELPRQEDFQIIKEVVLSSLRDFLPGGVNRRKITCLTMKEAYVQKMVKVFNEHDKWSLISLSNNRAKTVALRFVSTLRRQFEFSVDSFQIILNRMLESYWESERRQIRGLSLNSQNVSQRNNDDKKHQHSKDPLVSEEAREEGSKEAVDATEKVIEREVAERDHGDEEETSDPEPSKSEVVEEQPEKIVFEICREEKGQFNERYLLVSNANPLFTDVSNSLMKQVGLKLEGAEDSDSRASQAPIREQTEASQPDGGGEEQAKISSADETETAVRLQDLDSLEFSSPPPAKKTCSTSHKVIPGRCPSPKLQRKMSRKCILKPQAPEKWSLLNDLSDLTTQMFPPIDVPKQLQPKPASPDPPQNSSGLSQDDSLAAPIVSSTPNGTALNVTTQPQGKPRPSSGLDESVRHPQCEIPDLAESVMNGCGSSSWAEAAEVSAITVEAECMYGDFDQAMDHLRHRLIATHHPEEIRGGGLLKYSDLLVRNFRPASETEIKSLERYMCSRFFIDFPDVGEQQRKIEAYLQCHFTGSEEASKYDYLMTLRRVIDESTVCLMGHERRQTLNMITVLALRVLGEQNAIPNTANVTCFYQPAPYVSEPIYSSFFVGQPQPPLVYHPYPLHVHMQTGLV